MLESCSGKYQHIFWVACLREFAHEGRWPLKCKQLDQVQHEKGSNRYVGPDMELGLFLDLVVDGVRRCGVPFIALFSLDFSGRLRCSGSEADSRSHGGSNEAAFAGGRLDCEARAWAKVEVNTGVQLYFE